jgi:hypothetical protein
MTHFVISQILVAIAFCFDLASFQFKHRKHILFCIVISASLISTHFILLDRTTAGLIGYVSTVRFGISYFTTSTKIMYLCMIASTSVFLATYTDPISILAIGGALVGTWASFRANDRTLRKGIWLTHNYLVKTPTAVGLEIFFLGSNLVGYYRYYIRPAKS